eukprot:TRINITY_DN46927_c0_g1_i1.p1 TRINITY_DN46927_c0_g1~~TRINITY_DN46927_c0_g1_i1.p1  ORF type:complete len:311 (+),score=55.10 TRINITY_DN46927_c0_g1_i1:237-1169(+)
MQSVAVIRSVQRSRMSRAEQQKMRSGSMNSGSSGRKNLLATDELCARRAELIYSFREEPLLQGMLLKYAMQGPWGLMGQVCHLRFFRLDPLAGTLTYWKHQGAGKPTRVLKIQELQEFDTNSHHFQFFLRFQRLDKLIRLKAESSEDYKLWLDAITRYIDEDLLNIDADGMPLDASNPRRNSTGSESVDDWRTQSAPVTRMRSHSQDDPELGPVTMNSSPHLGVSPSMQNRSSRPWSASTPTQSFAQRTADDESPQKRHWNCSVCGETNKAQRRICNNCSADRSKAAEEDSPTKTSSTKTIATQTSRALN